MALTSGTLIDDKFEIRSLIGSGGMGVVYEAHQVGLDRVVALKMLTLDQDCDEMEWARFQREALILSTLMHPNIVQFYAYGMWQSTPYIAMEKVDGTSLQHALAKNEPLSYDLTLKIVIAVCDALEHAHTAGVFHRDLKPSNIILTKEGIVKLIDFGLAKVVSIVGLQKLTRTGTALGSVIYMSPEQCSGQNVDAGCDIYSLGCVMYQCLTGVPPFVADNAVALMFQHTNEDVSSAPKWEALSAPTREVIAKCMAKNRIDRYSSAAALKQDLIRLQLGQAPELEGKCVPSQGKRLALSAGGRKVNNAVALALAGACAAALVSLWAFNAIEVKDPPIHSRLSMLHEARERMSRIVLRKDNGTIDQTDYNQLCELIEICKTDPRMDQSILSGAYIRVISFDGAKMDFPRIRQRVPEMLEFCPISTKGLRANEYFGTLSAYHGALAQVGAELSIMPLLEVALEYFPLGSVDMRAPLQLDLAHDYVQKERYAEARVLIKKAEPYIYVPEHIVQMRKLLKECDLRK